MTDTGNTIDVTELTARLGLPDDKVQDVLTWANADADHVWTEWEAERLIELWHADVARIDRERADLEG